MARAPSLARQRSRIHVAIRQWRRPGRKTPRQAVSRCSRHTRGCFLFSAFARSQPRTDFMHGEFEFLRRAPNGNAPGHPEAFMIDHTDRVTCDRIHGHRNHLNVAVFVAPAQDTADRLHHTLLHNVRDWHALHAGFKTQRLQQREKRFEHRSQYGWCAWAFTDICHGLCGHGYTVIVEAPVSAGLVSVTCTGALSHAVALASIAASGLATLGAGPSRNSRLWCAAGAKA